MSDEPSRVEEYIGHAASLRQMADNTQNPEMRKRLLGLADLFECLAQAVEKWENERFPKTAH
jgi:hypothetical protein